MGNRQILNTAVKGAGIVAIGLVLSKFISFFFRLVVARYIGPEAYGQLSLGLTVLSIAGTLSLLAVNESIKKFVSEFNAKDDPESIRGVVLSSIQITLPLSIVAGASIYLGSGFIANRIFESPELVPLLKLFAFLPPIANLSSVLTATITAFKEMKYRVIVNQIAQPIIQLIMTIVLVFNGYGLIGAGIAWFVGVVFGTALKIYYLEREIGPVITRNVEPSYNHRAILSFSAPLVLSAVITAVLGWTDTIFLGYFMDDASVGFYNAALPTAALILIPYQALNSLALPSFSEAKTANQGVKKLMENLLRWTLITGFPAFILMVLFSDQILRLLFTREYTVAGTALLILALGQLYSTAAGHLNEFMKSVSRTSLLMKNTIANLLLNITLNILLIPEWGLGLGIEGAALATTTSLVVVNSLLVVESYYFESVVPFSTRMWKPIVAAIVPILPVYLGVQIVFQTVPLWVLVPGFISYGLLYLPTLVLLGGVEEEDRDIIVGLSRRINKEQWGKKIADSVI